MKSRQLLTGSVVLLFLFALIITPSHAQDTRGFRGDWNGWGYDAMTLGPDGTWRITIEAPAASTEFKIAHNNWAYEWTSGNNNMAHSPPEVYDAFTGGANGGVQGITAGSQVTIAMNNVGQGNQGRMVVQQTANDPVTFSRQGQEISGKWDPNKDNIITVTLSDANPSETVYVRYTTDNWASSTIVATTGSGVERQANIGTHARNTTIEYYALSSTFSAGNLAAETDLKTIRFDNAGHGNNASYTIANIGNAWHLPTDVGSHGVNYLNGGNVNPYTFDGTESSAFIYNGNQFAGGGDPGDQSAMIVHHRRVGDAIWNETGGGFDSEHGNDKFWLTTLVFNDHGYDLGDRIEYYIEVQYTDRETTYLYGSGPVSANQSFSTFSEDLATANSPWTFQFGSSGVAIPEPGTLGLMLGAGLMLVSLRRRLKVQ